MIGCHAAARDWYHRRFGSLRRGSLGNDMWPDLLPDWALKRVGKDEGCPMAHGCCETKTYIYIIMESCTLWLSEQMHCLGHRWELLRYPFPGGQLSHFVFRAMPIRSTSVNYTHLIWVAMAFGKQLMQNVDRMMCIKCIFAEAIEHAWSVFKPPWRKEWEPIQVQKQHIILVKRACFRSWSFFLWHFSQWARCVSSIITSSGAQAAPGAVATGDLRCGFISCWKTALGDLRRWPWETMGNHGGNATDPADLITYGSASASSCTGWVPLNRCSENGNLTKQHDCDSCGLCQAPKSEEAQGGIFLDTSACQRDLASIGLVKGFSMYSETLHSRMQLFSNQVNKMYPPTGETRPPSCCATCRTSALQPIKWYPDRTWSKENRLFQLSAVISEHESHGCMNLFVNIRL